jgi:mRNA interferase MazF
LPTFEAFATISVPFPLVERPTLKRRPALVVSRPSLMREHGLAWVLMITSAANAAWPEDISIDDLQLAGLSKPSVIRPTKLATIDTSAAQRLGNVTPAVASRVLVTLRKLLADSDANGPARQ